MARAASLPDLRPLHRPLQQVAPFYHEPLLTKSCFEHVLTGLTTVWLSPHQPATPKDPLTLSLTTFGGSLATWEAP